MTTRRRLNVSGGARVLRTVIKHTPEEFAALQLEAERKGVTRARLYENALQAGDAHAAFLLRSLKDDLSSARRMVAIYANNVNQVAKKANATGEVPEEFAPSLRAATTAVDKLLEVAARIDLQLS